MKKEFCCVLIVLSMLLYQGFTLIDEEGVVVSGDQTLLNKVVVIDPGHGGLDNGASSGNYYEDEINLEISYILKEELESRGAVVYMTRYDDQDLTQRDYMYSKQDDMYLRVREIDAFNPDYLLSIHLNASTSSSAWGSQVFYYKNSTNGLRLADSIHESMALVTGTTKDISPCEFMVLRATQTLGVLIECGFLTNGNERGQLVNESYQRKIAVAICEGLIQFDYTYIPSIN